MDKPRLSRHRSCSINKGQMKNRKTILLQRWKPMNLYVTCTLTLTTDYTKTLGFPRISPDVLLSKNESQERIFLTKNKNKKWIASPFTRWEPTVYQALQCQLWTGRHGLYWSRSFQSAGNSRVVWRQDRGNPRAVRTPGRTPNLDFCLHQCGLSNRDLKNKASAKGRY